MSHENELVAAVVEFLEAAVHTVLKARSVYSPSLFDNRRLYGVTVSQCRHPGVCSYIATVLGNLKVCFEPTAVASTTTAPHPTLNQAESVVCLSIHCAHVPLFLLRSAHTCMQPLLLRDTLQEVVVVFNDADGHPNSKCSFIVQVRGCLWWD